MVYRTHGTGTNWTSVCVCVGRAPKYNGENKIAKNNSLSVSFYDSLSWPWRRDIYGVMHGKEPTMQAPFWFNCVHVKQ